MIGRLDDRGRSDDRHPLRAAEAVRVRVDPGRYQGLTREHIPHAGVHDHSEQYLSQVVGRRRVDLREQAGSPRVHPLGLVTTDPVEEGLGVVGDLGFEGEAFAVDLDGR